MSEKIREIVNSALERGSREFDSIFSYSKSNFKSEKDQGNTENDLQKLKTRIIRMIEENFLVVDWSKNDSVENFCEKLTREIVSQINEMRFKKALNRVTGVNPNESWVKFIRWIGELRLKTKQEIFEEMDALKREKKEYVPYKEVPTFHDEGSDLEQDIEPEVEPEEIPLPPEVPTLDSEEPAPFIFTSTLDHYLALLADSTTFVDGISDLVQKNDPDLVEGVILSLLERIEQLKKAAHDAEELWEQAEARSSSDSETDHLKNLLSLAEAGVAEKQQIISEITKQLNELKKEIEKNNQAIEKFQARVIYLNQYAENLEASSASIENRLKIVKKELQHQTPDTLFTVIELLDTQLSEVISDRKKQRKAFELEIKEKTQLLEHRTRKLEEYKKQVAELTLALENMKQPEVPVAEVSQIEKVDSGEELQGEENEGEEIALEKIEKLKEELDFAFEVASDYERVINEQKIQIDNLRLVVEHLQSEHEKKNVQNTPVASEQKEIQTGQTLEQVISERRSLLLENIHIIDDIILEAHERMVIILKDIRTLDGEIVFLREKEEFFYGYSQIGILEHEGLNVLSELREFRRVLLEKEKQKETLLQEREKCDVVQLEAKKRKDLCSKHLQALELVVAPLPAVENLHLPEKAKSQEKFPPQAVIRAKTSEPLETVVPIQDLPRNSFEIEDKDKITKVEGLPFPVEFTREQEFQVRSLEQWIEQFRGLSKEQIEKQFPIRADENKSTFQTKKERYDKMVESLLDGTFLSKLKMAIVILGSMRGENGQFVGRVGSKVGITIRSLVIGLAQDVTEGNRMTSLVYGQIENFPDEYSLLIKIYRGSKYGLSNELLPFGQAASCVWTKDLLDEGRVTAKQLSATYNKVNEAYVEAKKKQKES